MDRPLLILDLDETLVYARKKQDEHGHDFTVADYFVSNRPYQEDFLASVFDWFRVAVWTSSGEVYAREVIANVFSEPSQLEFAWFSDRCTRRFDLGLLSFHQLKDLKKAKRAGYPLERILVVDDSPEKVARQYGNHIGVRPFYGDPSDSDLLALRSYLDWIRHEPNFRRIEKRWWRTHPAVRATE